jgi:hypothetical protein
MPSAVHADNDGSPMIVVGSTATAIAGAACVVGAGLLIGGFRTAVVVDWDHTTETLMASGGALMGASLFALSAGLPILLVGLERHKEWRAHHTVVSLAPTRDGGMVQLGGTF